MTDQTLWTRWREGRDGEAFATLVRGHLAAATDAARRCGTNVEDAEDAVQEALMRLARTRNDAPLRFGVRAWLIRQARDRARSGRRSRRRRAAREAESQVVRRRDGGTLRSELRDEVDAALARLPEPEREAVVLRYLHDLDYREMSHVLDLGEGACRQRVHVATRRLRAILGPRASALVAALGLAAPRSEAALITTATQTSSGLATFLTTTGVTAMSSTGKLAAAAVLGGALAATGLFSADLVFAPRPAPVRTASRGATEPGSASHADTAPPASLADASPDELAFLRDTLRKERHRRENAKVRASDSGIDILQRVIEHGADVSDLLADFERMRGHVRVAGAVVPVGVEAGAGATAVNLDTLLERGSRIHFGPGVFLIEGRNSFTRREDQHVLEITGAGRERTKLIWKNELLVQKDLENLRMADLTVELSDTELLDVRGRASVLLENVRLEGWWPSAGYSAAIGLSGGVYLAARGCVFAGGRSTTDGLGIALSVRGTAVAGFLDCEFLDVSDAITGWSGAARLSQVRFTDCRFENAALSRRLHYQNKPEFRVYVVGGRVRFGEPELTGEERRKKWGADVVARIEGVTFEPAPDASERGQTLRDLLEATATVSAREGEVLTAIRLVNRMGTPRVALGFYCPEARHRERTVLLVRGEAGWNEVPEPTPRRQLVRVPHVRRDQLAGVLGLVEAVRRSGIDLTEVVRELRLEKQVLDGAWSYVVVVERFWPARAIRLDARTGRVLPQ